jgi:hypothetical protein
MLPYASSPPGHQTYARESSSSLHSFPAGSLSKSNKSTQAPKRHHQESGMAPAASQSLGRLRLHHNMYRNSREKYQYTSMMYNPAVTAQLQAPASKHGQGHHKLSLTLLWWVVVSIHHHHTTKLVSKPAAACTTLAPLLQPTPDR